jgi:predicted DNA-binding transcriptional regulator AlpA
MNEQSIRLAGAHEVRELLGVSRQRVYQLAARADFPKPIATLAQGKLWLLGDIEQWMTARRLPRARRKPLKSELPTLAANMDRVEAIIQAGSIAAPAGRATESGKSRDRRGSPD